MFPPHPQGQLSLNPLLGFRQTIHMLVNLWSTKSHFSAPGLSITKAKDSLDSSEENVTSCFKMQSKIHYLISKRNAHRKQWHSLVCKMALLHVIEMRSLNRNKTALQNIANSETVQEQQWAEGTFQLQLSKTLTLAWKVSMPDKYAYTSRLAIATLQRPPVSNSDMQ